MDFSPKKRYSSANKNVYNSRSEKKTAPDVVSPGGIFSWGRCSDNNHNQTYPGPSEQAARMKGDLVALLSMNSKPSVETLFEKLEKNS